MGHRADSLGRQSRDDEAHDRAQSKA